MIKDNLTKLGLTANEAETYVYLLNNYKAKASEIARHLNVTHPAAKKILDSLISKGIVRIQTYSKTSYYFAEDGEKIIKYVQNIATKKSQELKKQVELAEETSSLLKGKIAIKLDGKTAVEFFKGKEGVEQLAKKIANAENKTIHEFVDTNMLIYTKQKDTNSYVKEYKNKNLQFDIIYIKKEGELNSFLEGTKTTKLNEYVQGPMAQVIIFDDKVIFSFITDDYSAILLDNQWVANTLLTLFKNVTKNNN